MTEPLLGSGGEGRDSRDESASEAALAPASDEGGTLGLRPAQAAALAWLAGWLSGAVVLWLRPQSRYVRVQALHAVLALGGLMALAIGSWGLGLLMAFVSPWLFRALTWLSTATWVALGLIWMLGLVQACRGRSLHLPMVSGWASRRADRVTSRRSTLPAPLHPL